MILENPKIIEPVDSASVKSDSFIAPTPLWTRFGLHFTDSKLNREETSASREPCVSAFIITGNSFIAPRSRLELIKSMSTVCFLNDSSSCMALTLFLITSFAIF